MINWRRCATRRLCFSITIFHKPAVMAGYGVDRHDNVMKSYAEA